MSTVTNSSAASVAGQPSSRASALVVIVNYRTPALVIDCLRSLEAEVADNPSAHVIVVDNDSGDDSCSAIGAAIESFGWSAWARLLASPVNGGFAYGNNLAIRAALEAQLPFDFCWLLNPDTCVHRGAMRAMVEFMRNHPRAGVGGSLLELEDGTPWPYAFRFPSLLSELEKGLRLGKLMATHSVLRRMGAEPAMVDWVSGASMMIRREVLQTVGLMDEGFFLYYEETDYCLQVQRGGWECWYIPHARVLHIAGQSTGVTDRKAAPRRLPRYWFDSRRRYFIKNHGRGYAIAADLAWVVSYLLCRGRQQLRRRPANDPPKLLRDFVRASALFATGPAGVPISAGS